ncbi:MAG: hypothetical protein GF311_17740 [Candidatus Lokiarchaeota archaeon]|nr:hypothetical protein [Candidatus Lokiarchaeota archaeon]
MILKLKQSEKNRVLIKRTILELGTKYPRIEMKEIAEKCGELPDLIIDVLQKMIKNEEIYAAYFKTSQTVAFNQQANINEIDLLMERYNDWETTRLKKK